MNIQNFETNNFVNDREVGILPDKIKLEAFNVNYLYSNTASIYNFYVCQNKRNEIKAIFYLQNLAMAIKSLRQLKPDSGLGLWGLLRSSSQ